MRATYKQYVVQEVEQVRQYPVEIIAPLLIYYGHRKHAEDAQVLKDLHIRAVVLCGNDMDVNLFL